MKIKNIRIGVTKEYCKKKKGIRNFARFKDVLDKSRCIIHSIIRMNLIYKSG